ncbi:Hypothetical protein Trvi_ORF128 [Trabala vishnou gigantina nucleopolyhedrovirus]|uniref:Hypothetical protein n=1 Tax=Trabala vishnou gigantina nucleopolyhedrovirus TaxID=2863583 RepID=UPI002481B1A6|nr:Hypothetical protein QKU87_gp128 [Trabala vishnou gigantina nucleopolyhedrovirus]QYC92757.1 Hypothetical protein Trvi_ORF128 [Trabala vishnou gigantina nucleopolyhedrovirus]
MQQEQQQQQQQHQNNYHQGQQRQQHLLELENVREALLLAEKFTLVEMYSRAVASYELAAHFLNKIIVLYKFTNTINKNNDNDDKNDNKTTQTFLMCVKNLLKDCHKKIENLKKLQLHKHSKLNKVVMVVNSYNNEHSNDVLNKI